MTDRSLMPSDALEGDVMFDAGTSALDAMRLVGGDAEFSCPVFFEKGFSRAEAVRLIAGWIADAMEEERS